MARHTFLADHKTNKKMLAHLLVMCKLSELQLQVNISIFRPWISTANTKSVTHPYTVINQHVLIAKSKSHISLQLQIEERGKLVQRHSNLTFFSPNKMSLQWTLIAGFLYAEIAVVLLLVLPVASPKRWNALFKSRFLQGLQQQAGVYFLILLAILVLFLLDAIREMRKYSSVGECFSHLF